MVGCGENWCFSPWDWMVTHILLKMAIAGAEGLELGGGDVSGDCIG
jgi:hypothetical protein